MDSIENDHKAIVFAEPKLFEGEAKLYETKWWDYRFMHPVEATETFAESYVIAVRSYLKKQIDLYIGANAKVLKKGDLFLESKTTVTSMWKARKTADAHGIPYDFWCRRAMDYADTNCWPYYPKPAHLYSEKAKETAGELEGVSIVEYITAAWEEWKRARRIMASLDFYMDSKNIDHPYFIAYQALLVQYIKCSRHPILLLGEYAYETKVLNIEYAEMFFSKNELEIAKKRSEAIQSPVTY